MTSYELGSLGQIPPGEGRTFRIGNLDIAIFRSRDGQLHATQAYCPHKYGPLADGVMGAGTVVCPLHGYRFDLVTGCEVSGACQALATYPVALTADGRILMELERQAS